MSGVCAIGIDVGGTKIAGGLVDPARGLVGERRVLATRAQRGGAAVLEDAVRMAEGLARAAAAEGRSVVAVGLGICELVSPQGAVTSGHTVDWRGLAAREALAHLGPAAVEADVRAHALAEARLGAGRPYQQFVFVTVGTGISSCIVLGGRPHAGARGNALVLASSPHSAICGACGSLQQPILEEYAAGPAITARYNQRAAQPLPDTRAVLAAAAAGDALACEVAGSAADALGVALGWLVNVVDPEALVIGGGLGLAGGLYWERAVSSARAHIWADASRDLPIVPAELGADAGLVGAALAALG